MKNKFLLPFILMLGSVFFAAAESPMVPEPYDADKYIESDVVPLAGRKGFSFETKNGEFMLKPYVLLQTAGKFNYYDDEQLGLDDQDNVANSGFEIPYAILGFSGRAFNKLTFNLTINAAKTGASLLQQAWVDVNLKDQLRFRVGKFKRRSIRPIWSLWAKLSFLPFPHRSPHRSTWTGVSTRRRPLLLRDSIWAS